MSEKEPPLDDRPDFIKDHEVEKGEMRMGDERIPFTVLKKELEPSLPGFLGFSKGKHLFISEEVPEDFRIPQLCHEIVEFVELKGKEGRCLESLKRELETVREEIKKEYIHYRRMFFERLVAYYQDSEDEDFKREIVKSMEHLRSIDLQ